MVCRRSGLSTAARRKRPCGSAKDFASREMNATLKGSAKAALFRKACRAKKVRGRRPNGRRPRCSPQNKEEPNEVSYFRKSRFVTFALHTPKLPTRPSLIHSSFVIRHSSFASPRPSSFSPPAPSPLHPAEGPPHRAPALPPAAPHHSHRHPSSGSQRSA